MKKILLAFILLSVLSCQDDPIFAQRKKKSFTESLCGEKWFKPQFQQKLSDDYNFHQIGYTQANVYFKEKTDEGDGHIVNYLLANTGTSAALYGVYCVGKYISPVRKSSYFKLVQTLTTLSRGKLYKIDHSDYEMIYGPDDLYVGEKDESNASTFVINMSQFINFMPEISHFEFTNKASGLIGSYDYNNENDEYHLRVDFQK